MKYHVRVVENGYTHTSYSAMAERLNLTNWIADTLPYNGQMHRVVSRYHDGDRIFLGIEDDDGYQYIIDDRAIDDIIETRRFQFI